LVVEDLSRQEGRGGPALDRISFTVRAGEILAIAGVDGNGQKEMLDCLAGITPVELGRVSLNGVDITRMNVRQRLAAGLAYIPVDRARTSLVPGFSIADNLAMRDITRGPIAFGPFVRPKAVQEMARSRMDSFNIRASHSSAPASSLSGGNQQKIVLAREIGRQPKVLLAFQPTWGLDPGAARFVLDRILLLRDAGAAILYVSAELDEVLTLGDCIAVLSGGRMSEPMTRESMDVTRIGMLMAGAA
jgi:simple sugar transport system ATP-binding protein